MTTGKAPRQATPGGVAALEAVMREWQEDRRDAYDEHSARREAGDALALFAREPNGLLVLQAFRAFRQRGLPVPELIMLQFDRWADRLQQAATVDDVAAALDMAPRGKVQAVTHLRETQRSRRVVSRVAMLIALGVGDNEACRRAAATFRMGYPAVRSMWRRWGQKTDALREQPTAAPVRSVFELGSPKG